MGYEHASLSRWVQRLRPHAVAALACLPLAMVAVIPHETGHWAAARAVGMRAQIHAVRTTYLPGPSLDREARRAYVIAEMGGSGTPELEAACRRFRRLRLITCAAGPAVSMSMSGIGLAWLFRQRRRSASQGAPTFSTWLATLLALSLPVTATGASLALLPLSWPHGDDYRLALLLPVPHFLVALFLTVIAGAVGVTTILLQPRGWRWPLLIGGVSGAAVGAVVWEFVGPWLLAA